MKTSVLIAQLSGGLAFLLAGSAAAQIGTLAGTTCGSSSAVNDLSSGVYLLLGPDITYARQQPFGSATLTADSAGPPLVLAVCTDPPSPIANCTALEASPGIATAFTFVPTRPATSTNIWIVVDSLRAAGSGSQYCNSYTLTITGPLDG